MRFKPSALMSGELKLKVNNPIFFIIQEMLNKR